MRWGDWIVAAMVCLGVGVIAGVIGHQEGRKQCWEENVKGYKAGQAAERHTIAIYGYGRWEFDGTEPIPVFKYGPKKAEKRCQAECEP